MFAIYSIIILLSVRYSIIIIIYTKVNKIFLIHTFFQGSECVQNPMPYSVDRISYVGMHNKASLLPYVYHRPTSESSSHIARPTSICVCTPSVLTGPRLAESMKSPLALNSIATRQKTSTITLC